MSAHNIICLEAEWLYNDNRYKFDLKSEPLLQCLKEFHKIELIHRHILDRNGLVHYMKYLAPSKKGMKKFDIVYFACHGRSHAISLEGEDGLIDLKALADLALPNNFFENRIVHFGSCKTLANPAAAEEFKKNTKARLVCGYTTSVDAMKCAIVDMALFNHLININNVGTILNEQRSKFWKSYRSILDELGFVAY